MCSCNIDASHYKRLVLLSATGIWMSCCHTLKWVGTWVQPLWSWYRKGLINAVCWAFQPTTAALQNVSHHSRLTVEQRAENADWFRKIGTNARLARMWQKSLLLSDQSSFCVPAWNSALYCERCPDRMRDFFVLSYQASMETILGAWFPVWDVWEAVWYTSVTGSALITFCRTCAQMAAVPTLPSWSWPTDGTEDMPADGCCRLSGALQEVSCLRSGTPPTPCAHLPHWAPHPRGWQFTAERRTAVTNITGAGVGVIAWIPLVLSSEH